MGTNYIKAIVETLMVLIPGLLFVFLILKRADIPFNKLVIVKVLLIAFFSLLVSYGVLRICIYLDITGLVRWASVSISALLGMELLHWKLVFLSRKGNKIANKLLNVL